MPSWGWVLIAVAAALVLGLAAWALLAQRRSRRLQGRFGPEYSRVVDGSESRREAEAELAERASRRDRLDIRPLGSEARDRYAERWRQVQSDFVEAPATAVADADTLVTEVMRDRGYPMDDFEQRSADVSVDYPDVVENYRQGHRISQLSERGEASTEDLRQAVQHYRRLFDELLEPSEDEPTRRERDEAPGRPREIATERTRR